jgi:hypothetical protein
MTFARANRTLRLLSIAMIAGVSTTPLANGQQTTNTSCTTIGNNTNCTSTTTDYAAQQQHAYEQGQKIGNALGAGITQGMQAHAFNKGLNKYCASHPGETWHYYSGIDGHELSSGYCPNDEDKALAAANTFMAKHKDYKPKPANSKALVTYFDVHNLDPREEKSYERAYRELKKNGQLDLYAK